jgi:hypothetical protein
MKSVPYRGNTAQSREENWRRETAPEGKRVGPPGKVERSLEIGRASLTPKGRRAESEGRIKGEGGVQLQIICIKYTTALVLYA